MTLLDRRSVLMVWAVASLFTGFGGDAIRNAITWYGYGTVVALMTTVSVLVVLRHRPQLTRLPLLLVAFLLLITLSIAWSFYPGASAIGVFAQFVTTVTAIAIATVLDGDEIMRALGWAFGIILSLSLLFELLVAFVIRAPVLPIWATAEDRIDPPLMLYWSRNVLLAGDRVQGIVGNSVLLSMIALLGLIVFGVQIVRSRGRAPMPIVAAVLAAGMLALSRAATTLLALVAVLIVSVALVLVRRARTTAGRRMASIAVVLALAAAGASTWVFRGLVFQALGRSDDLTGRLEIWDKVIGLAVQRPVFGWGWVSFWAPWVEPFRDLVTRNGVIQLHAHNAWLDVWLQLGFVGVAVLGGMVVVAGARALIAATHIERMPATPAPSIIIAAPLLITAQVVQSFAESRLLIEGGWVLIVMMAIVTKGVTRQSPARQSTVLADR